MSANTAATRLIVGGFITDRNTTRSGFERLRFLVVLAQPIRDISTFGQGLIGVGRRFRLARQAKFVSFPRRQNVYLTASCVMRPSPALVIAPKVGEPKVPVGWLNRA